MSPHQRQSECQCLRLCLCRPNQTIGLSVGAKQNATTVHAGVLYLYESYSRTVLLPWPLSRACRCHGSLKENVCTPGVDF